MKKFVKKIIFTFCCISIFISTLVFANNNIYTKEEIELGEYIQFGKYNGEPILWKIINFDEQGNPLLFSDKIISLKNIGYTLGGQWQPFSSLINNFDYENSSLRQWLNSKDKKVKWKTNMFDNAFGDNLYSAENGFLSSGNFTNSELQMIKKVTNKVFLRDSSKDKRDGGNVTLHGIVDYNKTESCVRYIGCAFDSNWNYNESYYDDFYYKNIEDSVFLLSHQQLAEYVYGVGNDISTTMTETLFNKYEGRVSGYGAFTKKGYWGYWLSDGYIACYDSLINTCSTVPSYVGVRPALYLDINSENFKFISGDGKEYNPYIITPSKDVISPSIPSGIKSSNITKNGFTISWTPSTDNVGVGGYMVYKNGKLLGKTSQTIYEFNNVVVNKTHNITIRSYDIYNNRSNHSNVFSIMIDTQIPSVPTNLISSNITSNGFVLTWTPSTDNVGVNGYHVYRNNTYVATVNKTTYAFTKLQPNSTHNITIVALDANKNKSQQSKSITVKTLIKK